MKVLVIDYGRGNIFSIAQALREVGAAPMVSGNPARLEVAERVVLPGVGAFGDAMTGLSERGLVGPLLATVARGTPMLGICVGCQVLLDRGEEFGDHRGLGLIPGTVARLPAPRAGDASAIRIPNVGWRQLEVTGRGALLGPAGPGAHMYFVHSYAPFVELDEHVMATIRVNGARVPVAIRRDNVTGVQFHPEKSGPDGLGLLKAFLEARVPA